MAGLKETVMLVLVNSELFDVGDPAETLRSLGVDPRNAPSKMSKLVRLGQDAAFAAHGLENANPGIRRTLAALFALSGEANCCLFLCPEGADSAKDVAVNFGQAPLTTMAHMKSAQDLGRLTATMINRHVWQVAPAAPTA